jgi:hypothetical protein
MLIFVAPFFFAILFLDILALPLPPAAAAAGGLAEGGGGGGGGGRTLRGCHPLAATTTGAVSVCPCFHRVSNVTDAFDGGREELSSSYAPLLCVAVCVRHYFHEMAQVRKTPEFSEFGFLPPTTTQHEK